MIAFDSYYGTSALGLPYLCHHGIKGQKWGVRRFQNEDGSLTPAGRERYGVNVSKSRGRISYGSNHDLTIKKGTKMYRVSENMSEDGDIRYVSFRDNDRNFYKGFWTAMIRDKRGAKDVYEHTFKVNQDLKIPSRDMREKILTDLSKDKEVVNCLREINPAWFDQVWTKTSDHAKASSLTELIAIRPNVMDKYAKRVMDLGYNAVIDDNSQSTTNEMPLIVLTARSTLDHRGSTKISEIDEKLAKRKYNLHDAIDFRRSVSTLRSNKYLMEGQI